MVIKSFDSVKALGDRFGSEVFRDISTDLLFVYDKGHNTWYRYRWTPGKREITFDGEIQGELPLVTQIYPALAD